MVLNELGRVVYAEWQKTPEIRSNIILDAFIVMPNHVHVIFMITENRGRMADSKPDEIYGDVDEFDRICHYIINNPLNWNKDFEHPVNTGATKQIPDDVWKEI